MPRIIQHLCRTVIPAQQDEAVMGSRIEVSAQDTVFDLRK
jgi:hypothetical protein